MGAPKWASKGEPVGPGPECAAIKKTLENVTFGGLSGVGQTGVPGCLWGKFREVHFGALLGGPLGLFREPSGDLLGALEPRRRQNGARNIAPVGPRPVWTGGGAAIKKKEKRTVWEPFEGGPSGVTRMPREDCMCCCELPG